MTLTDHEFDLLPENDPDNVATVLIVVRTGDADALIESLAHREHDVLFTHQSPGISLQALAAGADPSSWPPPAHPSNRHP